MGTSSSHGHELPQDEKRWAQQLPPERSKSGASTMAPPPLPDGGVPLAKRPHDRAAEHESLRSILESSTAGWLVSLLLHMVLLLTLAEMWLPPHVAGHGQVDLISSSEQLTAQEQVETVTEKQLLEAKLRDDPVNVALLPVPVEAGAMAIEAPDLPQVMPELPSIPTDWRAVAKEGLVTLPGAGVGGALSGRGPGLRQYMAAKNGGSAESEEAVDRALKWLAEHQFHDGSWSLQHNTHPRCQNKCSNPGMLTGTRIAATGLALLPFLGAGYTHKEGQYKTVVRNGIYYLMKQAKAGGRIGALNEPGGGMYSHGIATIVLCEAFAMTYDKALQVPAQQALRFICDAQDPAGGGWRYHPLQPGDTSVIGWQIMALKSGRLCDMAVPPGVLDKAELFLTSVQMDGGARYEYQPSGRLGNPSANPPVEPPKVREIQGYEATTAVGLLCRMFLGWKRDMPALQNGVEYLAALGPSKGNMYFNYYATQVMWHWEGEPWQHWNAAMRDQLIQSQSRQGHETGSWYTVGDEGSRAGGRLYITAMATMILEVYYRHMPVYAKLNLQAAEPRPTP